MTTVCSYLLIHYSFTQLSNGQIPILTTLLSLLHVNKPVFSQLVVDKVTRTVRTSVLSTRVLFELYVLVYCTTGTILLYCTVLQVGSQLLHALGEDDVCTAKLLCKTIACLGASGSFAISKQDHDQDQDHLRVGLSGIMEQLVAVVDAGIDMSMDV